METATTCTRCNGAKRTIVDRKFFHDSEVCIRCNGTGEEPEKYLRQQRVVAVIKEFNQSDDDLEKSRQIQLVWEGPNKETLRVSVNRLDLFDFWDQAERVLSGYCPHLVAVCDYGKGEHRAELVFDPND